MVNEHCRNEPERCACTTHSECGSDHPGTGAAIIEVENLTVERSGEVVVEDATFRIHRGDYIGMVGPNGGGKTTLLQAMLGILPARSGTIRLFGREIEQFREWEKIAYLSQTAMNHDIHFPLSVRELVSLGRIRRGRIGRPLDETDRQAVERTMEFLGIADLARRRIGHLSGGQKQRVFLAKALVREPALLILDEPVSGVDPDTLSRFYRKLSELNTREGITILMVSHDLAAVFCRMSHMISVNRKVRTAPISAERDLSRILKETYGEHFHFAYHGHACEEVPGHG